MKKHLTILIILIVVGTIFISDMTYAQSGIVPCGRREDVVKHDSSGAVIASPDETADCTICHFFILVDNTVDFLIFNLTPPIFLLMLVLGGGGFILAAGNPQAVTKSKKIITSALIGIVIVYGAYTIVGIFLQSIGLNTWTKDIYLNWWDKGFFEIKCDVPMASTGSPLVMAPVVPAVPAVPAVPSVPAVPVAVPPGKTNDMSIIMKHYGKHVGPGDEGYEADLNNDGIVNDDDMIMLRQSIA